MLTIHDISIQGFGPFADKQVIKLSATPGVTLVYGENMRGKTSLLNAIRYAFYGQVLGRGARARKLHAISNRELAALGQFGFDIGLSFDCFNEKFRLVRTCRPRQDVLCPTGDSDYVQLNSLWRDQLCIESDKCDAVLSEVLPEQISRFFLFDGELLQEYEKLLHEDNTDGRKLSTAIEQLLGVPLIKQARAHLIALSDEADSQAAKEASRSKNTEAIGNALAEVTDRRKGYKRQIAELEEKREQLLLAKENAEQRLKSQHRFVNIIQERDRAEEQLQRIRRSLENDTSILREKMSDAWRTLLAPTARAARKKVLAETALFMKKIKARILEESIQNGRCEICARPLDAASHKSSESLGPDDLGDVAGNLQLLEGFIERDISDSVRNIDEQISRQRSEVAQLVDLVRDKQTELSDADIDRLQGESASLADAMKSILDVERSLAECRKRLVESESAILRLQRNLARIAPADLAASRIRSKMLREASEVLIAAVEGYKQSLRSRIEDTATTLFRHMTTEQEYSGLRINENYGLHIVHSDSTVEDGRSAGAEHVVALALMGALQANAPIRGPVILDSPFGRLDRTHTRNVIAALPSMAPQVVLLVHSAEVEREEVRSILGESLRAEYELIRENSRKTKVERVR